MRALTRRSMRAIAGKYRGMAWRRPGNTTPEDSTRKFVSVVDSCPALSIARTCALCAPFDICRTTLVFMPTDRNGPPSVLNSYRAIPEAESDPVHAIVTAGFVTEPIGEETPTTGFVRSIPISFDRIASTYPALSSDWQLTGWPPSGRPHASPQAPPPPP